MAKKAATKTTKYDNDPVAKALVGKYGNIIVPGNELLDRLEGFKTISVSPALDIGLGGGIREGSQVMMTGDAKAGKTTTCMHFAAKCQAAGKKVVYVETEGRTTKQNFEGIKGLDVDKIVFISPNDEEEKISAETYLNSMEYLIKNEDNLVLIVDSLSNMVPEEEMNGEIKTGIRAALPRLLSMYFKRISNIVALRRAICVYITHNITDTGPSRRTRTSDCGVMLKYAVSTNISIAFTKAWNANGDDGEQIGQSVHWTIITSAAGGTPGTMVESWLRYGEGIDEVMELFQMANEFALIKKGGSWYTLTAAINNADKPEIQTLLKENAVDPEDTAAVEKFFKFQGAAKTTKFLKDNPVVNDVLYNELREIL